MMQKSSGVALVSALIFMFIVVIFLSIVVTNSINSQRNATDSLRTSQAQFAAEAGLDDAVATVWHRLWGTTIPPEQRSLTRYAAELAKAPLNLGAEGATYRSSVSTLSSGSSYSYEITRLADVKANEVLEAVVLRVKAVGMLPDGRTTRVLQSDFTVRRGFFPFDFALLTNKAECIFCHADIKSLDALLGDPTSDPDSWWDRTKVGVLSSLIMRGGEHAGTVSGSLLTRGDVYQQGGNAGVSDLLYTTMTVGQDRISQNTATAINSSPEYQADCRTEPNDCKTKRALYLNYPTGSSSSDFPDGELPNSFPLPIPDANNNRLIDESEWTDAVDESVSGVSDAYPPGTITADMQVLIGLGTPSWGGSSQTKTSEELGKLPSIREDNGRPANVVVLDGSNNPIQVTGTVFINGDVIIRGKVQGNGTILARGNIYVLGDLTYDCSRSQQNSQCDYKDPSKLPQLSLVAGGSILVGDYVTVTTLDNDTLDLLKAGNVQETFSYCKNNPPDVTRCGSDLSSSQPNFALVQLANWNRDELWKALNNPDGYTPRFYTYGESEVYYTNNCGHNSQDYSAYRSLTDAAKTGGSVRLCKGDAEAGDPESIPSTLPANVANAVKIDLNPKSFTAEAIKNLWLESVQGRPVGALRTDGLLYSANAVFSIMHSDNPGAVAKGQWDLRGALVAPDTGILTPGPCAAANTARTCVVDGREYENYGLRIYHDNRLRPRIAQDQKLGLFRSQWRVVPR